MAIGQRHIQIPGSEAQRSSLTATGTNFNISAQKASQSAQKQIEKLRNMQENASSNGHPAQSGVQSQSQISMKGGDGNQATGQQKGALTIGGLLGMPNSNGQQNNNANGKTTNFVRDNIKLKQSNQDNNLQNVAPVTAHHTDPQVSKKMMNAKQVGGSMANPNVNGT